MANKENRLPENSYICIQAFMVNDLKLSGNELIVYGLIYGFCMDKQTEFSGSIPYIQKWLNCGSNKTVHNIINKLIDKNLIIKTSTTNNPNDSNHYTINFDMLNFHASVKSTLVKNPEKKQDNNYTSAKITPVKDSTSVNFDSTNVKSTPATSVKITPNNINNNINNINSNSLMDNLTSSIPTLDDVLKYAKTFGDNLFIDGDYFYYYNNKHNWKDNNGCQIRNWKALFNNWNQLQKQKALSKEKADEELKQQANEKYTQLKAQKEKEQREYRENAIKNTHLICPKCRATYPSPDIDYLIKDNAFHCKRCNESWSATNTPQTLNKQAC